MIGDVLDLYIGPPAFGGGFVAHAPDGRVVFVRHAIEGERVLALITEESKHFLRADATTIIESSPDRVASACHHARPSGCGGCDWQHISLAAQRRFKAHRIRDQILRQSGLEVDVEVKPVPGDHDGLAWRTRMRFGIDGDGRVGLRRHRSHDIEPIEHCPLATPSIDGLGIGRQRWSGATSIDVACSTTDGTCTVNVNRDARQREPLPTLDADLLVNGQIRVGRGRTSHAVLGRHFSVSSGVFWQVHPGAPATLGAAVLKAAGDIAGERVVDLYCGAGLFTALLARAIGPQGAIIGIERDGRACDDARHNIADLPQASIMHSAVTTRSISSIGFSPSLAILDPSRDGAGADVMSALCQPTSRLRTIIYVSCEPSTFARDLRAAREFGWTLVDLQAFDLFPMTEHVELVAVLRPGSQRHTNAQQD